MAASTPVVAPTAAFLDCPDVLLSPPTSHLLNNSRRAATNTPQTPNLPLHVLARRFLNAATPPAETTDSSFHLVLNETPNTNRHETLSVHLHETLDDTGNETPNEAASHLINQSPTLSPTPLSQTEPLSQEIARFLETLHDNSQPLLAPPVATNTQASPTACCSVSACSSPAASPVAPDLDGPQSMATLFRHPAPAPRSMQRRFIRSTAADFFGSPPPAPPTPINRPTGDVLYDQITANLRPLLHDSQVPDDSETSTDDIPVTPPTSAVVPPAPTAALLRPDTPSSPTNPSFPPPADDPDATTNDNSSHLLQAFHEKWSTIFTIDLPWLDFCNHCSAFAVEAKSLATHINGTTTNRPGPRDPNRPQRRRPPHGRPLNRFNGAEAQRLQSFYRHSKKRAIRQILQDDSPAFSGSTDAADIFFTNIFAAKPCNVAAVAQALQNTVPSAEREDALFHAPAAQEIKQKLRSAANTSPGPDRVEYRHLKRVDGNCSLLSRIFARCVAAKDVPPEWKTAVTVLIHKKGPSDDAANFRPIALMSCIYKLLMGVLAKRLSSWAIDNELLSPEQKSARPSEGCYEHTYLLKSVVADTRRHSKKLNLAWLDLRNAFGSIPHPVIHATLSHMGAPPDLVEFVKNAYTNATTSIRTSNGSTRDIPINAGVKQGCPLSPILFNLCLELVIRSVKTASAACRGGAPKHFKVPLSVLAYADDLVFITRKKDNMDSVLQAASTSADILGLSFRPDKCASLTLHDGSHAVNTSFQVQNQPIPTLSEEDSYRYLGVPIGLVHNINDLPSLLPKLIQDLDRINESPLAPWQKLDAIRTFVQPCLTFSLRAGNPLKRTMEMYRSTLVRVLRQICALPARSCVDYFFASKTSGGLAFQDPLREIDAQTVTQAIKTLSSSDPTVASIARAELLQTVGHAGRTSSPTPALTSNYLSALPDDRLATMRYRVQSLWTRTRKACRYLKLKFTVPNNGPPLIGTEESGPILAKDACRFLHTLIQAKAAEHLQSLPDQGKVARALAIDQYANGSTWQFNGLNIRFRDWRFIHRARLNCLPLNSVKSRWSNTSPRCRHCTADETLPHTICHCPPNMVLIRQRHNKIVNRLVKAVRFGEVITDRSVAESNLNLRPDIVVKEDNKVIIVDVCCPFENDPEALQEAETRKTEKYQPLKAFFLSQGLQCEVFGFVVGSLGAWYPPNEPVLRRLGMTTSYKSLFRKLCCTDAIQGSNDIYRHHLGITDDAVAAPDPQIAAEQMTGPVIAP